MYLVIRISDEHYQPHYEADWETYKTYSYKVFDSLIVAEAYVEAQPEERYVEYKIEPVECYSEVHIITHNKLKNRGSVVHSDKEVDKFFEKRDKSKYTVVSHK